MLAIAAVVVIGILVALPFVLPDQTVKLDEAVPPGAADAQTEVLRTGMWQDGDPGHKASGAIDLVRIGGAHYLRFTDFEMTAGPDVYLYLTQSATPKSTADVEGDGTRISVRTDADSSPRLNERGSFFVALDMTATELATYQGVAAWCDDFNVLFAGAALT